MVMMKERGFKEGMIIWIGTWVAGFAVGGIVSHLVM
jgi:ferrous iron transport protein B